MQKVLKYCVNTSRWQPKRDEWLTSLFVLVESDVERERIRKFMFKRDAKHSLVGQLLIRYCLAKLNLSAYGSNIERTSHGRPFLKSANVDFNVAHAGDFSIIACSTKPSVRVGTDTMKVDADESDQNKCKQLMARYESIMASKFTLRERDYVASRPSHFARLCAFYRVWCLKESFVKATGDGIGFNLERLDFHMSTQLDEATVTRDTKLYVDSALDTKCRFYEQQFGGHIMTLCVISDDSDASDGAEEPFKELSIESLLQELSKNATTNVDLAKHELWWQEFAQKSERPGLR